MQEQTLDHYINGIKTRDNKVVQDIYTRFLPGIIGYVVKNGGQQEDGRDVFNKVIYQMTARLEREDIVIKSTFKGYLFTACKNIWRRELKKIERVRVTKDNVKELYYVEQDMTQATLEQERWELFHEKLEDISTNCREVLKMFFNKLSSRQIMEKLDYGSEATVRQRIFKCKAQLAKSIQIDSKFQQLNNQ